MEAYNVALFRRQVGAARREIGVTGWRVTRGSLLASLLLSGLLLPGPAAADADGKAVYEKNCAGCHGPDGKGATPAGKALKVMDLGTKQWAAPEAIPEIEKAVREGVPRMPPLGTKLKPEEIAAVARYTQEMVAAGNPQQ